MKYAVQSSVELVRVIKILNSLDLSKEWMVSVTRKKKTRTLNQHGLYWMWLSVLEKETGNFKEHLHEFFKDMFLEKEQVMLRCKDGEILQEKTVAESTTRLSTVKFNEYLEKIRMFAIEELGVNLIYPDDIDFIAFVNEYKFNE